MNRRTFLKESAIATGAIAAATQAPSLLAQESAGSPFQLDLTFGKLGMSCDQQLAVELASRFGFQSVGADTGQIGRMNDGQLEQLNELRESKGLKWSSSGLPVNFRGAEDDFQQGLASLREVAPKLKLLGVPFMGTWLSPSHGELTYLENFTRHTERIKAIAVILEENDIKLALEYVGTQLLRFNRKHPFIHTAAETLELIAATGSPNIGLICDSWHWWTSGESAGDLQGLSPDQIVWLELNDAPVGIPREYQQDGDRRLPAATGVLPVKEFLKAIAATGFSGPVMAEPFYPPLRELSPAGAAERVAESLRKAVG